jgi:hypothetical protein
MKNEITLKSDFELLENNKNIMRIKETNYIDEVHRQFLQHEIKKQELIEDFVYKNLETNILQAMKLKIENELFERRLKGERNNENS